MNQAQRIDVRRWWRELSVRDRESLRIARQPILARFIESDPSDADVDLYEWIVGHEHSFAQPRAFHICTRHPFAELAPSFVCPFANATCPMRAAVDACRGRTIRFVR